MPPSFVKESPLISLPLPSPRYVSVPGFAPPVAVNRARLHVTNSSNFIYSTPARRVLTELRLVPPIEHGLQRVQDTKLHVAPLPYDEPRRCDEWGNVVIQTRHDTITSQLTIVAEMVIETQCAYTSDGAALPIPVRFEAGFDRLADFAATTALTAPDAFMEADAKRMGREISKEGDLMNDPFGFASRLAGRVHQAMTFRSGSTGVGTTAREAWSTRTGVCQDYTHILLTFCRLLGLPARYVSGMVPGEGVMHAWAEVLLPAYPLSGESSGSGDPAERLCWYPIDPTYNKWVNEKYVAVAVGRDYRDALPTSGTYYGGKSDLRYKSRVVIAAHEIRLLAQDE